MVAYKELHPSTLGYLDKLLSGRNCGGDRLFDEDMDSHSKKLLRNLDVQRIRHTYDRYIRAVSCFQHILSGFE